MAFTSLEIDQLNEMIKNFINKIRPPLKIRKQLDYGYKIINQSIEIYEIRPDMNNRIENISFVKATYDRKNNIWKLYWMRADLKWHGYEPEPEVSTIEDVLRVIEDDEYCCFFG